MKCARESYCDFFPTTFTSPIIARPNKYLGNSHPADNKTAE